MPTDTQFKRFIAYKLRIGDLLIAKPIFDADKFSFADLGDKRIQRVNIAGNIVDKYESERETKYLSMTLDDGSGQIKLKVFGDDTEKFKNIVQGETVVVIGLVRYWNNELYIAPEIIKEQDQKYLFLRKLELEKERSKNLSPIQNRQQAFAIKDQILNKIKDGESDGGIDTDKIIMDLRETSPEIINQEIRKLLEEGIIFEPRPGKLRWLG